jgi:LysM repeat protein
MKKLFLTIGIFVSVMNIGFAQLQTAQQYVLKYKELAIREMRRTGVPAAITLAQGLLETENGNSELFKNSNNHFGIKCKAEWTKETYNHDDDLKGECFRVYKTDEDSYRDHSNFLLTRDRYAFLFHLNPLDYKAWAHGLKNAGYATNPRYPDVLIHNIELYNLQQYSVQAMEDTSVFIDEYAIDSAKAAAYNAIATLDSTIELSTSPITVLVVNGSKCIFEASGTSLLAIATDNNINLNSLLEYNDLKDDGILAKDQLVFLQKKAKTGDRPAYIVQDGENLYDVAQKNGMQLQYLLFYNELKATDVVTSGTTLYLQPHAIPIEEDRQPLTPAAPVPITPAAPAAKIYKVKPSEGIYTVARKNGVTIQQIRDWNHLSNDSLLIGQELIIGQ